MTEQDWKELEEEFESDLDEHMAEWEKTAREHFASTEESSGRDDEPSDPDAESMALAEMYADHWNLLAQAGMEPPEEEIDHASDELAETPWIVHRDESGEWGVVRVPEDYQDGGVELAAAERAPKGGVQIAGPDGTPKFYRGGQWIPAKVVESLSPEDRAKLETAKAEGEGRKTAKVAARKARGSVDAAGLRESLRGEALAEPEARRAKAAFRALHRHHGELAIHRIEELANDLSRALASLPEDHPNAEGIRDQFGKRLRAYGEMIDWAREKGVTGEVVPEPVVETPVPEVAAQESSPALLTNPEKETTIPSSGETKPTGGRGIMQLNLGDLVRDKRRVEAMRQIIAANPDATDAALAAIYASEEMYDQHTPPADRKTHYDTDERIEACLRFILPQARK